MDEHAEQSEQPEQPEQPEQRQEPDWKRRRRLASVFGDTEPDTTRDERGEGAAAPGDAGEEWLKRQVPPHHGS